MNHCTRPEPANLRHPRARCAALLTLVWIVTP